MAKHSETEIAKMMKALDLTREEAIEMLNDDDELNGMTNAELESDLSAEHKQVIKSSTKTTSAERKKSDKMKGKVASEEKKIFVDKIYNFLVENYPNDVEIITKSKLFEVKVGEKTFKVNISENNKPKKA